MAEIMRRPIPITVIGWVFIILSSISIIFYACGYFFTHQLLQPHIRIARPSGNLSGFPALFFNYYWILSAIEILISLSVLIISYYFLKLRAWARTSLELISWTVFIYMVLSAFAWVLILDNMEIPREMVTLPRELRFIRLVFLPLFSTIMFALPILFINFYLRSRGVREAFK